MQRCPEQTLARQGAALRRRRRRCGRRRRLLPRLPPWAHDTLDWVDPEPDLPGAREGPPRLKTTFVARLLDLDDLDDPRASPVPRMPAAVGPVMPTHPNAAGTRRVPRHDRALLDDASRKEERDRARRENSSYEQHRRLPPFSIVRRKGATSP
jgi:hypothetical protein